MRKEEEKERKCYRMKETNNTERMGGSKVREERKKHGKLT
jgi:hypothetical protein